MVRNKKASWQVGPSQSDKGSEIRKIIETHVDPAIVELKASTKHATKQALQNLRSFNPAIIQTAAAFCVSNYMGLSNEQQAVSSIAAAAAALLPDIANVILRTEANEIREKSPFGVLLKLEKLEGRAQKLRLKDERRRKKLERKQKRSRR